MKDIKDFLPYYLGCDVLVQGEERTGILTGVMNGAYECEVQFRLLHNPHHLEEEPEYVNHDDVKLTLRPLSDMTTEEAISIAKIHGYDIPEDEGVREEVIGIYDCKEGETLTLGAYLPVKKYYDGLLRLLKNGFDLFGLIESGLAIDKTKLHTQPPTDKK